MRGFPDEVRTVELWTDNALRVAIAGRSSSTGADCSMGYGTGRSYVTLDRRPGLNGDEYISCHIERSSIDLEGT